MHRQGCDGVRIQAEHGNIAGNALRVLDLHPLKLLDRRIAQTQAGNADRTIAPAKEADQKGIVANIFGDPGRSQIREHPVPPYHPRQSLPQTRGVAAALKGIGRRVFDLRRLQLRLRWRGNAVDGQHAAHGKPRGYQAGAEQAKGGRQEGNGGHGHAHHGNREHGIEQPAATLRHGHESDVGARLRPHPMPTVGRDHHVADPGDDDPPHDRIRLGNLDHLGQAKASGQLDYPPLQRERPYALCDGYRTGAR